MNLSKTVVFIYLLLSFSLTNAQEIGINTETPEASSLLDVYSTDKGFLLPRVALIDVTNTTNPIANPVNGLLIWNTNASVINGKGIGIYVYNNLQWQKIEEGRFTLDQSYDKVGSGLGRTIIADAGAVRIEGTDGLWVTGTHGSGATIDAEITGTGTRLFYNPRKSAFRAGAAVGTSFNENRVGNFSGTFGYNNTIYGGRNFGANANNITSNVNTASFGNGNNTYDNAAFTTGTNTSAGGNNSFATGQNNVSTGYHAFVGGYENRSKTQSEAVFGYYSRNKAKFIDTGSGASFDQTTDSASNNYNSDGLFAIGNGNPSTRHDALSILKSGAIEINEAYTLPLSDGSVSQIAYTDGSGNVNWKNRLLDHNISQITLYADDQNLNMTNTGFNNLGNITAAINPLDFEINGNIQVQLLIKYASKTGSYTLRLRDDFGNNIIAGGGAFIDITTSNGGVIYSNWTNYSAVSTIALQLNGRVTTGGDTLAIETVYVLIKPQ